jgi:hypothetical protein
MGHEAGYWNQTGGSNTIVGYQAGKGNGSAASHSYNSLFGYRAGYVVTTGIRNTFSGAFAGDANTDGNYNTFFGYEAGTATVTGDNNSFFGYQSGLVNTGEHNTFIGSYAGLDNTSGGYNLFAAENAGNNNTTASGNVALGWASLGATTTGGNNTALGALAGGVNTTGTNNTYLGYGATSSANNFTNSTAIGNGASVNASNKVRIGNGSVTVIEGTVAYTTSDGRFKYNVNEEGIRGLEFIEKLRPVNYQFNGEAFDKFLNKNNPDFVADQAGYAKASAIVHSGFIAQEVEQAAKDCGFTTDIVHVAENEGDNYSVAYATLVVPLVKAIQEQQATIRDLKGRALELQYALSQNAPPLEKH